MSGLEFLQPVYGFAAAIIPSIVFSIVIMRTTKDTTLVALFRDAQHTD
jgi:F0F1-type ATP synthase assembly protein I